MAERIRGLSIGLNLDDAGIDRKLGSIKRSFRDLNSGLKTNMNNFRYTEKSISSYKDVMGDLTGTIDGQKKNVEDLGRKYDELVASGKSHTAEASRVRQEYNKQADNLNRLEHQLEATKDGMHSLYVEQSRFTKMGNVFSNVGTGLQSVGQSARDVGGALTRNITLPIAAITSAAAGMTAAFGWGRLVGLDSAQAQLKGLGYNTEEVGRISEQVTSAIEGGMTTMAEGTSVAAGALAAGVEEGAELEKYIKLVGDAAVGANRPVSEMATIFNRVQGTGKLMTGELNQVEDSLPGFSQAMADHLGVSFEKMREMVTAGEVTSTDFLTVMDGFAGDMASAYSNSWQGMVANTKAYIGILGENLLGGVFEQSKQSIAEFIEFLKSDEVVAWAQRMGESIGTAFSNIVQKIQAGIMWFKNLSGEQQKWIGIAGALVVAAGPLLTIFGTLTIFLGKVFTALSPLLLGLGKMAGGFTTVLTKVKPFAAVFPKLSAVIGLLTGPVGWITAGIIALGTAFTVAYTKSETFRNIVNGLVQRLIAFIPTIVQFGQTIFNNFMNIITPAVRSVERFFVQMFQQILAFWKSDGETMIQAFKNGVNILKSIISVTLPIITTIFKGVFSAVLFIVKTVWQNIKGVIQGGLDVILGIIRIFSGLFTGNFSKMWEGIKQVFSGAIQIIWNGIQLMFYGRIIKGGLAFIRLFTSSLRSMWTNIVGFFKSFATSAWQNTTRIFGNLYKSANQIFSNMVKSIFNFAMNILRNIRNIFTNVLTTSRNIFTNLYNSVRGIFSRVLSAVTNAARSIFNNTRNIFTNVWNTARNIFTNLYNSVRNIFSNMVRSVSSFATNILNNVRNRFNATKDAGIRIFQNLYTGVRSRFTNIWNAAKDMGNRVKSFITDGFRGAWNSAKSWIDKLVSGVKGMKDDAIQAAKDLADGLKKHAIGGLNKMIDGVNWVGDKLGMGNQLISPIKFSRGTQNGALSRNTLATVGDRGPGNGQGADGRRETVVLPNGKMFLTPNIDTQMMLPKGTKIFNGRQTQQMAEGMFSRGTMGQGGIGDKIGEGLGWIKEKGSNLLNRGKEIGKAALDKVGDVWDYMKNPGKLLDMALNNFGVDFSAISKVPGELIKAGYNKLKDGALEKVKKWFSEGGLGNGKKASFMNYRMTTPYSPNSAVPGYPTGFNGGRHYGIDYGTPIGTPVHATLAGTVSKMHNNGGGLVAKLRSGNITQFFMHLQDIIKTGAVKAGEMIARTGNSGAWTTGPHIHWQAQKGSQVMNRNTVNPKKVLKGHEMGGHIQKGGLFNLHDDEYVIPMNHPSEAMKLIALAGEKLAGKSKQTRELPNMGGSGGNETVDAIMQLLDATLEQNKTLKAILQKDNNVYIGDDEIGKSNDRYNQKQSSRQRVKTGRLNYGV